MPQMWAGSDSKNQQVEAPIYKVAPVPYLHPFNHRKRLEFNIMTVQEITRLYLDKCLPADLEKLRFMEAEIVAAGLKTLKAIAETTDIPIAEVLIEEHNLLSEIHICLEIAINILLQLA